MPLIDVTDILSDPDVAGQTIVVIRRQEVVNNFGEATFTQQQILAVGSIQPSGDQSVIREEGFDAQVKSVKVYTTFRLRGVSKQANNRFKPDWVLFNGDVFEVQTIEDYTPFGAGFIEAECSSIDYVDLAPFARPSSSAILDLRNPRNSILAAGARPC